MADYTTWEGNVIYFVLRDPLSRWRSCVVVMGAHVMASVSVSAGDPNTVNAWVLDGCVGRSVHREYSVGLFIVS